MRPLYTEVFTLKISSTQKKNFREIEISKYKGFRFCKKSNFRKNKTGLRRITGQT